MRLVGTSPDSIISGVNALFDDDLLWRRASQTANPYGDGQASSRIVDALMGRPVNDFVVGQLQLSKYLEHAPTHTAADKTPPASTYQ